MRFKQFLEALDTPPHLPKQFYEQHLGAFKHIQQLMNEIIKTGILDKYRWTRDFISYPERDGIENGIDAIRYINYNMKTIVDFLEYVLDEKDSGRIMSFLKHTIPQETLKALQEYEPKEFLDALEKLKKEMEGANGDTTYGGWDEKEYGNFDDLVKTVNKLLEVGKVLGKMKEWYPNYVKKVQAHISFYPRQVEKYYHNASDKPPHETIETLYHATTAMSSILKGGFKTRDELGRGGLGGGPSDVISFTSDIQIAEAIVWGLRRVVEIAKGKTNFKQLQLLGQKLGADMDAAVKYVTGSMGGSLAMKNPEYGFSNKPPTPRSTEEQKTWLYEIFRYILTSQSKIYNPLFFGVGVKDFENLNPNEIGILASEVDMSQVKDYLASMEEYRVPVSAIKRTWKVPYGGIMNPLVR